MISGRPALVRTAGLLVLWVVIAEAGWPEFLVGIAAAVAATCASLRLLPPNTTRLQLLPLAKFVLRFLRQSVVAGADVARRALDPGLPLNPGFVRYSTGFPPGPARNVFTTLMSLLPGTVPIGPDESGALLIHCLDTTQPVTDQLSAEEALLAQVMGRPRANG